MDYTVRNVNNNTTKTVSPLPRLSRLAILATDMLAVAGRARGREDSQHTPGVVCAANCFFLRPNWVPHRAADVMRQQIRHEFTKQAHDTDTQREFKVVAY